MTLLNSIGIAVWIDGLVAIFAGERRTEEISITLLTDVEFPIGFAGSAALSPLDDMVAKCTL
jgi:hypothetical protein